MDVTQTYKWAIQIYTYGISLSMFAKHINMYGSDKTTSIIYGKLHIYDYDVHMYTCI